MVSGLFPSPRRCPFHNVDLGLAESCLFASLSPYCALSRPQVRSPLAAKKIRIVFRLIKEPI